MTEIEMVSNSDSNHLEKLQSLFQSNTERLIIASPYLATNIRELLDRFTFSKVNSIELITTFKPKDAEQLTKPKVLRDFFDFFRDKHPKIKVKLHVDNKLHGKLYFFIQGSSRSLLLSSANFTNSGLCNNHEWGLLLKNNDEIEKIIADLQESIEYENVTYHQISRACQFADLYERDHPDWIKKPEIFSDILDSVNKVEDASNVEPKYFLKPIRHSESPILLEDQRDFSELHQDLHFSKKKPKGVMKGDIVITTAVGAGSLLSYFKVTGGLQHVTKEDIKKDEWKERWPWYMEGRNQSTGFGSQWWTHNIRCQDALNEFREKYPDVAVTHAGGFSLGTINWGNDKVQITKEFGEFLISKINKPTK
ncbi:MAG: phospholipase D-like domain-containing protein [Methylococcaceae bacterium]